MTNYEAKIALIQAGVRKYNDVVFSVPSASENKNYIVTAIDGVAQSCQCIWTVEGGWTRELKGGTSHKCAHALAVEAYIAEENAASQSAPTQTIIEQAVEVVREVESKTARRGFVTRPVGVRRDPERGVILR